jgi:Zn-dependent protease with chaperone function
VTTALHLMLFGAAAAWLSPPVLARMTRRGINPRLSVGVWFVAVAVVLAAGVAALVLMVAEAVAVVVHSAVVVLCLELVGIPERTATPGPVVTVAIVGAAVLLPAVAVVRVARAIVALRARSRDHARTARLVGRSTDHPDVVVLPAARPAAFCVTGRPHTIVVTRGAVDRLGEAELAAVLAHERAHLRGRHPQLTMVLRALADVLGFVPLFRRAAIAVTALLEMCADDDAVRRHGRDDLLSGMLALAAPAPAAGMAVAATAVAERARRLLVPARRELLWGHAVVVSVLIVVLTAAPAVVASLCRH